jgi:superoxide dismutase, Fe-Mn family
MNRRDSLKMMLGASALFGAGTMLGRTGALAQAPAAPAAAAPAAAAPATGPFSLPPLGYAYEALEPHIDATTMNIHHTRHHNAFIGNLNGLVARWDDLGKKSVAEILNAPASIPEPVRGAVRNNLGGHWNHTFFWGVMTPGGAKEPGGDLKAAITSTYGDLAKMKEQVNAAGVSRFGSGWAWLVVDKDGKLAVMSTPNQDTPLETGVKAVVLGVDVWEHAYYLKYQNKRADYLNTWWNTVNWDKALANMKKGV